MAREEAGGAAYRQGDEGAERLRAELLAAREAEAAEQAPRLRPVARRRLARVFAGAAGLLWALVLVGGVFSALVRPDASPSYEPAPALSSLELLLLAWPVMAAAYTLGWLSGGLVYRRFGPRAALTGELYRDIDALKRPSEGEIEARIGAWELASFALPLMALALFTPLTLHSAAFALDGVSARFVDKTSDWIELSVMLVGHAHLVLAGLCYAFAAKMRRTSAAEIAAGAMHGAGVGAVGWTTLAAAIPGGFFLGLPPLITGVTGMVFVPAMFVLARRAALRERAALWAL